MTACPVPSCGCCSAQRRSSPAIAFGTVSPPWPYTTTIRRGARLRAQSTTCASRGLPASGCSTFGRSERIRLPIPAARITTFIFSFCIQELEKRFQGVSRKAYHAVVADPDTARRQLPAGRGVLVDPFRLRHDAVVARLAAEPPSRPRRAPAGAGPGPRRCAAPLASPDATARLYRLPGRRPGTPSRSGRGRRHRPLARGGPRRMVADCRAHGPGRRDARADVAAAPDRTTGAPLSGVQPRRTPQVVARRRRATPRGARRAGARACAVLRRRPAVAAGGRSPLAGGRAAGDRGGLARRARGEAA